MSTLERILFAILFIVVVWLTIFHFREYGWQKSKLNVYLDDELKYLDDQIVSYHGGGTQHRPPPPPPGPF